MTATRPRGWRMEATSTLVEAFSVMPPPEQMRNATSEFDDF